MHAHMYGLHHKAIIVIKTPLNFTAEHQMLINNSLYQKTSHLASHINLRMRVLALAVNPASQHMYN